MDDLGPERVEWRPVGDCFEAQKGLDGPQVGEGRLHLQKNERTKVLCFTGPRPLQGCCLKTAISEIFHLTRGRNQILNS